MANGFIKLSNEQVREVRTDLSESKQVHPRRKSFKPRHRAVMVLQDFQQEPESLSFLATE
ncbi:Rha family regulatory protein [Salmonella phage 21]|nr:Rha family regulatory protein [Salmonella phage 21]